MEENEPVGSLIFVLRTDLVCIDISDRDSLILLR